MPATYTHDRFGKDVYRQLTPELRKVIRDQKKLYLIGLHGPDIFFYYHPMSTNPIVKMAHQMHEEPADAFFARGRVLYQRKPQDGVMAYLLGFACHFLLDSACHPYIDGFAGRCGVSHAQQEAELDRVFLLRDGKNPFTYERAGGICPFSRDNWVIQKCFPDVALEDIIESLKGMKFYTSLLNQQYAVLRSGLLLGMKIAGVDISISDQVLRRKVNPRAKTAVENLLRLYERTLEEAPEVLEDLAVYLEQGGELAGRFHRSFC